MSSMHTRQAPNGTSADVRLPVGVNINNLKPGQKIVIEVRGVLYKAVVDLMVAAFWGGPQVAFANYDKSKSLFHVEIKLVWEQENGWQEKRSLRDATEEEFLEWRSQFIGETPPTPMP